MCVVADGHQCESCSDVLVCLFTNDEFEWYECGGLSDLVGSDDFKRFVSFEHFLVFFVDGGIDFDRVEYEECFV